MSEVKVPVTKYSYEHQINVDSADECHEISQFVFNNIADVVAQSLGPFGTHSLIARSDTQVSTKDGFHILCNLLCSGPVEHEIYHRMISKPCNAMNNEVGDGTTTVVLFTREILNKYNEFYPNYVDQFPAEMLTKPPRYLYDALEIAVKEIESGIREVARPMQPEDVYNIAMISSNGNTEYSSIMQEIYDHEENPDISVTEGPNIGVRAEYGEGLKMPISVISPIYINNATERVCEVSDVIVLVSHHRIANAAYEHLIEPLDKELSMQGIRLLIVAPSYDELFLKRTWQSKIANETRNSRSRAVNTVLAQYPNHPNAYFGAPGATDFAVLMDTVPLEMDEINLLEISDDGIDVYKQKIYDENGNFVKDITRVRIKTRENPDGILLGYAGHIKLSEKDGFFEDLHPNETVLETRKHDAQVSYQKIEDELNTTEKQFSFKLQHEKQRISRLNMRTCHIYYGASDSLESQLVRDTLDDVVRAVSSAKTNGVVYSTQTELIKVVARLFHKAVEDKDVYMAFIYDILYSGLRELITKLYRTHPLIKGLNIDPKTTDAFTDYDKLPEELYNDLFAVGRVLENAYGSNCTTYEALTALPDKPLNLLTLKYDDKMVVSANTDIQVVRCACDLLKVLLSSNQLIMTMAPIATK